MNDVQLSCYYDCGRAYSSLPLPADCGQYNIVVKMTTSKLLMARNNVRNRQSKYQTQSRRPFSTTIRITHTASNQNRDRKSQILRPWISSFDYESIIRFLTTRVHNVKRNVFFLSVHNNYSASHESFQQHASFSHSQDYDISSFLNPNNSRRVTFLVHVFRQCKRPVVA